MQLIALATLLTSVISQNIIIRTTAGPMALDQHSDSCLDISGTAISSEVRARGTLVLYKNRNCGRGRYAWARGNFDYNPYYEFNSARFIPRRNRVYGDSNDSSQALGASNDSDDSNGGGEADGEPSYYHGPGYNYNNYHYNDYNNRYPGRYY